MYKGILYLKAVIEELTSESVGLELNVDNQSAIKITKKRTVF